MAKKNGDVKRKPIPKKLRFEVFKRDMFTCQYCGRKAPDVVLHVDHITPVSKGGKNNIMNLVTSCSDCNMGKGAEKLSEQSLVEKQRRQAEFLAQRREQIEMLRDWQMELIEQENLELDALDDVIRKMTRKYTMSEKYRNQTARDLIRKYGLSLVMGAVMEGYSSYQGDLEKMLSKLPGICACKADPNISRRVFLLNIMNKKFWDFKRNEASPLIQRGMKAGGDAFYNAMLNFINNRYPCSWNKLWDELIDLVDYWEAR